MDTSFTRGGLARRLKSLDFYEDKNLVDESYRRDFIKQCLAISDKLFKPLPKISKHVLNGKEVYSIKSKKHRVVLRKCQWNVATRIKNTKNRSEIIRELKTYLKEGTQYRVYRLDIHSFFETCEKKTVIENLKSKKINTQTVKIIENVLKGYKKGALGIPRGLEISSPLAELYLERFDDDVKSISNVIYYSRFVDDIIIITDGFENSGCFVKSIEQKLPKNIAFNDKKKRILYVSEKLKNEKCPVKVFDYLGYKISIKGSATSGGSTKEDKGRLRQIEIDMSDKKRKKMIFKINKAFFAYFKNNDFKLLYDRLLFLASNRNFVRDRGKVSAPGGIYYNYSEINVLNKNLKMIDAALKSILLHGNKRMKLLIDSNLSKKDKRILLKVSFVSGFKEKAFKRFNPDRLKTIAECW